MTKGRLAGLLRRVTGRGGPGGSAPRPTLARGLAAVGLTHREWRERRRRRAPGTQRLPAALEETAVEALAARFPATARATIDAAEAFLEHRFDLLGSGPFTPEDPDRPATPSGYRPIDWLLDPVSGERFPRGFPAHEWDLASMRPGSADIKLPWELGRCQHMVPIAQAFLLTGDERFAREIADEIEDFTEANPVGSGIHWACTMDVALRAVSWALALELIDAAALPGAPLCLRIDEALFAHGAFIERHLENLYEVTSNHYLSNLLGMLFLGVRFAGLPGADRWRAFARRSLDEEIEKQILEDGADFESSIPYHRFVTEMFLAGAHLAAREGKPLTASTLDRLRGMVELLHATLRPDGLMPVVGDADDGRLHIFHGFSAQGPVLPQDPRHIFAPAARILDEPSWAAAAGPEGEWEAAWWGLEAGDRAGQPAAALPPVARLFPDAGIAVARERGSFLLITNGPVGTDGFGNHKHNDQLSFEVHCRNEALIVDPGSYVYTGDPALRDLFRGVAYHNTVRIDGAEQHEIRPGYLFRLFEKGRPRHLDFRDERGETWYRGTFTASTQDGGSVRHERCFRFLKEEGVLLILDTFSGGGEHRLEWHYHCAPGIAVREAPGRGVLLEGARGPVLLALSEDLERSISAACCSPSYGVRLPCRAIDLAANATLDGPLSWIFAIGPVEWFEAPGGGARLEELSREMVSGERGGVP